MFLHDAIDYMTTEADLRRVIETAFRHTRCGGTDAPDGRGARYLAWTSDPDPRDTWLRVLAEAGFEPRVVTEETTEDRTNA